VIPMLYIAENLKTLRKNKGWTQEEMAETIGVSPQSVSKWERGDTYPDITLLPALANIYKTSVDAIIGMDKINETEAQTIIFKTAHEHLSCGDNKTAAKILTDALKTFPNDESIMSNLALVLSLENDPGNLKQAVTLCERILSGNPTEKVRHTTRAAMCFIYFKLGEKDKAMNAAKNLPHTRESRENVQAELRDEPSIEDVNMYLRFVALGEEIHTEKLVVSHGFGMESMTTVHNMFGRYNELRKEIEAQPNCNDLRKLPYHIMSQCYDGDAFPYGRVKVSYRGDTLLDDDFIDPSEAVDAIISALRRMVHL